MKKNVIALLLSIVMAMGSVGSASAFAAETTAMEAVEIVQDEEAVEAEASEENGDTNIGATTEDVLEVGIEQEPEEDVVQVTEEEVAEEIDAADAKTAMEEEPDQAEVEASLTEEEEAVQESKEESSLVDDVEAAEEEEPAVVGDTSAETALTEEPDVIEEDIIAEVQNEKLDASNPYPLWNDEAHTQRSCTSFAWQCVYDRQGIALPVWGHGITWLEGAQNAGIQTGDIPIPGAVAVWDGGIGHVAYVTAVASNSEFTVDEGGRSDSANGIVYGYTLRNHTVGSIRAENQHLLGFIYPGGAPDSAGPTVEDFHVGEIRADGSGFTVMAKVTDPNGIKSVQYATWTEKNGGDDLQWYDGYHTDNNGYFWHRVNFSDHNNEKGTYIFHIYAYDNLGNLTNIGIQYNFSSTGPTCTDFHVGEFREGAFTILAKVTDINGIEYVNYAVWTDNSVQGEVKWYEGHCTDNNDYYWARINFSDHNNEKGNYVIHMWVKTKGGEYRYLDMISYTFPEKGPTISDIKVSDASSSGYTVTCKVTSINDDIKVSRVQCPTWTLANNDDDLVKDWVTNTSVRATDKGNGVYEFKVKASQHNYETGLYRTHLYAYDVFGNYTSVAVPDVNVHAHSYSTSVVTKKATCVEAGSQKKTCTICGNEVIEKIPATGHTWNTDYTTDKEATCSEEGSESIHCTVCGTIKEGSERAIAKTAHKYGSWKTVKEATCTTAGSRKRTCTVCGYEATGKIAAKGHTWNQDYTIDKKATTTEEGSKSIHCSVCDAIKEGSKVSIPKVVNQLGKTSRGDMFNLANNVKVTWYEVPGAKYYKVYREGVTDPSESLDEPVIVTDRLIGWDAKPGLTNGHAYRYKIVASLTGEGDSSGDSPVSYTKLMYRLKTVVIRSAKNTSAGAVTVKYDKTTSGDSYVLQYSENQDMSNAKTKVIKGANTTSYTIGGLKKGKTYYISIRVRKTVDGICYYTTFGVAKKVTITK